MKKQPGVTKVEIIADQDMREAIARIALTTDGVLLYRFLQRELQRITRTSDAGTLQVLEGRRTYAHDLMGLMAPAIEAASSDGPGSISDTPIVFAGRGPAVVRPISGARRRVPPSEPEPGESS